VIAVASAGTARPASLDDGALAATVQAQTGDLPAEWRRSYTRATSTLCSVNRAGTTAVSVRQFLRTTAMHLPATVSTTVLVFKTPEQALTAFRHDLGTRQVSCRTRELAQKLRVGAVTTGRYPVTGVGAAVVARWFAARTKTLWYPTYGISDDDQTFRYFIHMVGARTGRIILVLGDIEQTEPALRPADEAHLFRRMLARVGGHS
jgi:hypothetical protein